MVVEGELAYTNNDINTFSKIDKKNDNGYGARVKMNGSFILSKKDSLTQWSVDTKLDFEALDRNFKPIEQYRAVEFDRDWNTRNKRYFGNEIAAIFGANFKHKQYGNLNVEGQQYRIGSDYQGYKAKLNGLWRQKGFKADWDGSYLSSNGGEGS